MAEASGNVDDRPVTGRAGAGHRTAPHPADLIIEAWAPTAERCVAEAVLAMVEGFADLSAAGPVADREFVVCEPPGLLYGEDELDQDGADPESGGGAGAGVGAGGVGFGRAEPTPAVWADELVTVLDEVLYRMDASGELPRSVEVRRDRAGDMDPLAPPPPLVVRFVMADASQAVVIGAVPKAVSLHELSFGRQDDQWACRVLLDV